MDVCHSFIECQEKLRLEAENRSLRKVAAELGYPPCKAAMLSHVLGGRSEHVSRRVLNDLRKRLGLPPEGDCRKHISVSQTTFERANRLRRFYCITWDEWVGGGS